MEKPSYENSLPPEFEEKMQEKPELLNAYMEEYRLVIETQMHFNDLIIRFRSFTLTAYTTIFAGVLAFGKFGAANGELDIVAVLLLSLIPNLLWLSAFIIDLKYYHRMLNGAVKQARKFDNSFLSKWGLFGMTTTISKNANLKSSKKLVVVYYLLPVVGFFLIAMILFFRELSGLI